MGAPLHEVGELGLTLRHHLVAFDLWREGGSVPERCDTTAWGGGGSRLGSVTASPF